MILRFGNGLFQPVAFFLTCLSTLVTGQHEIQNNMEKYVNDKLTLIFIAGRLGNTV